MAESSTTPAAVIEPTHEAPASAQELPLDSLLVEEDLVIEEVSIDGMCGVY